MAFEAKDEYKVLLQPEPYRKTRKQADRPIIVVVISRKRLSKWHAVPKNTLSASIIKQTVPINLQAAAVQDG